MIPLLVAATFPVAVFLYLIYNKDTEKEPKKLLWKTFKWGMIIVVPAVILESILDHFNVFESPFMHAFYTSFVVAAFVEEGLKFWVLYKIIWRNREFDQHYDGIVYAVFVSLGFAFVENILYVLDYGMNTAVMRAILAVPGHGLDGVIMGYFFAIAKFSSGKQQNNFLFLSLLIPIIFHGLYDFLLFYAENIGDNSGLTSLVFILFVVLMYSIWKRGIRYIKNHHAKDMNQINPNDMDFKV